MKGETAEDIAAGSSVLRRLAVTIPGRDDAIDIVGTGGDGMAHGIFQQRLLLL